MIITTSSIDSITARNGKLEIDVDGLDLSEISSEDMQELLESQHIDSAIKFLEKYGYKVEMEE